MKKQLALRLDFNLFDAFKLFDKEGKGYASYSDIMIGLKEINYTAEPLEVDLWMKRYGEQK
jgi:Ca2+-binding EF-hand superfamily protein